jgi:peptidoglycan/xylan/chitin deacetylase (PgdA/CDA1 family)
MEKGVFVISLDFELLWGVFDKINWKNQQTYFENTRKIIPEILKLFETHEIGCTWATVGMLFNENWEEWNANLPDLIPEYQDGKLSAYEFGKSIQSIETEKLCFAPEIIKILGQVPKQEIATHTYSHYYCLEEGQNQNEFRSDLEMAKNMANKFGYSLHSLVFPRNQFNPDYLEICDELNIKNIRSNPANWYWKDTQNHNLANKIFRTADAYFGFKDKSYRKNKIEKNKSIVEQKASRFLRPYSTNTLQNKLRLSRILKEMEESAIEEKIYHLWWHPHNFGSHPREGLQDLKVILSKYSDLKHKYNYCSSSMRELSEFLEANHNTV